MEFPRLGVKSEWQLLAYTTATAMPDLSHSCDLHHSSRQHQILNPLSKPRIWTCVLMYASQICFCWATRDPSRIYDLHHSSSQCRILNPLSEARDWTGYLMVPSQIHKPLGHDGNSSHTFRSRISGDPPPFCGYLTSQNDFLSFCLACIS